MKAGGVISALSPQPSGVIGCIHSLKAKAEGCPSPARPFLATRPSRLGRGLAVGARVPHFKLAVSAAGDISTLRHRGHFNVAATSVG